MSSRLGVLALALALAAPSTVVAGEAFHGADATDTAMAGATRHGVERRAIDAEDDVCPHAPDRLIVRFEPGAAARTRSAALERAGASRIERSRIVPGLEVVRTTGTLREAAAALRANPNVRYVELDCTVTIDATPNDPSYALQWGLHNTGQTGGTSGADINAPQAWDIRTSASAITVAIIDTGIQVGHPDLAGNLWLNSDEVAGNGLDDDSNGYVDDVRGFNFIGHDGTLTDGNGHGTHVAGTIGARGNNGVGVTGVAWTASLMSLKAFDDAGNGYTSAILEALDYAAANGARVVNNSWTSNQFVRSMYDAFLALDAAGVLSVAAAGNSSQNADAAPEYPAAFRVPSILSVAATTHDDELASFSNHGIYNVDLAAPGASILSTVPGSGYGYKSGTSMATPHVSGVAALVWAANPSWTAQQVADRILGTTRAVAALSGRVWTGGVVDAAAALGAGPTVPPPPHPPFAPAPLTTSVVADPNPTPPDAPPPPTLPEPEVIDASDFRPDVPSIAVDASGAPWISYTERHAGVHLWSKATGTWQKRTVSSAFDDLYWQDLQIDGAGVPTIALQRAATSLEAYSDPGIVMVAATSPTPGEERITASCPDSTTCFEDWQPSLDYDAVGDPFVAFSRYPEHLAEVPPDGGPSPDGAGIYLASRPASTWIVRRLTESSLDRTARVGVAPNGTVHVVFIRRDGSNSGVYHATDAGGAWSIRRLTDYVEDGDVAMAVDSTGVLHVVTARFAYGAFYLRRSAAGTWAAPVRIHDGGAGNVDLALDGSDKLHVAIGLGDDTFTVDDLVYATNKTGSWTVATVETGRGAYPSIAADDAGHAFIAYLDNSASSLNLTYATNLTGTWQRTLLEPQSSMVATFPEAYVVDAAGYGHVALDARYGSSQVGLWYGTNRSGSWAFTRVSSSYPQSVDLAIDTAGKAHIAFIQVADPSTGSLLPFSQWRVGYATNATGSWSVQTVATGQAVGAVASIALDSLGRPWIAHPNAAGTAALVASRASGSWVETQAASDLGVGEVDLAMAGTSTAHLAVRIGNPATGTWRIVHVTGSGTTWARANVSNGANPESAPRIARASDGTLWIVSWWPGGAIQAYRKVAGLSWTKHVIASSGFEGPPSLAIDPLDVAHVAWQRNGNYDDPACTVPMCSPGPGLFTATFDGAWVATRQAAYPIDYSPEIAAGPDGSLSVVWVRINLGLLRLVTRPGRPTPVVALAPASDTGASSTDGITKAQSLTFNVTFDRPVTGVAAADFSRTGTATGCVIGTPTGAGAAYQVVVSGCSAGTVVLTFAADGATDGSQPGPLSARSSGTVVIDRTAPRAAAPTVVLRSGAALASASTSAGLLAKLSWSATEAGGAGLAGYDVARSYDGGAYASILTGTAAMSSNVALTPGHTYRYRARATDVAGNVGGWVAGPTLKGTLLQQGNSAISYSGSWTTGTWASHSGGSVRYAGAAGASAKYTFTGRGIAFVTTKRSNAGKVRIYLDGVLVASYGTYSSTTTYRFVAFAKTWASSGTHTIRLVVVGTAGHPRVHLDAFEVLR